MHSYSADLGHSFRKHLSLALWLAEHLLHNTAQAFDVMINSFIQILQLNVTYSFSSTLRMINDWHSNQLVPKIWPGCNSEPKRKTISARRVLAWDPKAEKNMARNMQTTHSEMLHVHILGYDAYMFSVPHWLYWRTGWGSIKQTQESTQVRQENE